MNALAIDTLWFRDRLRAIKMSQRELGRRLGLEPSAISLTMRGQRKMTMPEAKEIANHLAVTVAEVMRRAGIDVRDDVRKFPIVGWADENSAVHLFPAKTFEYVIGPADLPDDARVYQVRAPSRPIADNFLLYIGSAQLDPKDCADRLSISACAEGVIRFGVVRRGYRTGSYNIMMLGDKVDTANLVWASPVLWIRP